VPAPCACRQRAQFDEIVHFNLMSAFPLTRLAVPPHAGNRWARGWGQHFLGSVLDVVGMAAYGAVKADMNQMTNIPAYELAPKVGVNTMIGVHDPHTRGRADPWRGDPQHDGSQHSDG
jgi:NAD(P)-dependent dehydrogenase (short-subunit alcohol dehydrogenase family)